MALSLSENYKKRTGLTYNGLNIIIFICAVFLFIKLCKFIDFGNIKQNIWSLLITVLCVHFIKCLRLYLVLHKTGIPLLTHIKTYCKVTPVSVIFPFKFGELFRIYCYGYVIKNYVKSTLIILLDRFMDTAALLTIIIFVLLNGGHLTIFIYLLFLFLIFLFLIYKNFSKFYEFWKDYCLSSKAEPIKLEILKYLEVLSGLYNGLRDIVHGSGFVLYLLSVLAWIIEILNLTLLMFPNNGDDSDNIITEYLLGALNLNQSQELYLFILFSSVVCITAYISFKLFEAIRRGK